VLGFFTEISAIEFHPFNEFGFCETRQTTQRPNKRSIGGIDDGDSSVSVVQTQANFSELPLEIFLATGVVQRLGQQHPQSREIKTLALCDLMVPLGETPAMIQLLRLKDLCRV
jgi:hypothetical protein